MKLDDSPPLLIPGKSTVLLIFMPSDQSNHQQRVALLTLAEWLQKHLGDSARVLKIDKTIYPDVVQSFDITYTPTFVLVRQGIELWRQVGMPDEAVLTNLSKRLLTS